MALEIKLGTEKEAIPPPPTPPSSKVLKKVHNFVKKIILQFVFINIPNSKLFFFFTR